MKIETSSFVFHGVLRSIRVALEDLQLDSLDVIHAGERTFPLAEKVRALPLARVWDELDA